GAPVRDADHARRALECGLAMQKALRELDALFAKKGWPMLRIGVGLNCGTMSVGDMGSHFRRSYTVMGDAVNLASRLEDLTKEDGGGRARLRKYRARGSGLCLPRSGQGAGEGQAGGRRVFRADRAAR